MTLSHGGHEMLVLMRQPGDTFTIGPDISVQVLSVVGDHVRIGIVAPLDVPIVRDDAKCREVKSRMAAGEPLHRIEGDLDLLDNQGGRDG